MKFGFFKNRMFILFLIVIGSWIISLLLKPPSWSLDTIFYLPKGEEKRIFEEKKGLDTSSIKVFYYNKTSIYFDRYLNNFFALLDINSYFFEGHPREDVPNKVFRMKILWIFIFPFIIGLWKLKIGWKWLIVLVILSILKNPDGWDIVLSIPILLIINNGFINTREICTKS